MSVASPETKVRPSAGWYALVAVLWIASIVVFSLLVIKPIASVFGTDLTAFANGDKVSVGSDGISVYVQDDDELGACTLTGSDGTTHRMEYLDLTSDFDITTTGPTLTPYASTPNDLAPGSYTISCEGGDGTLLATGNHVDEGALERDIALGVIFGFLLGGLGLIVLIVLLVRRHNSKGRIRSAQAAAYYGAWPQQGYGPYGQQYQQPQQGYDPYGQQQQQQPPAYDPYGQQQQQQQPQDQPAPATEPYGGYPVPSPESPAADAPAQQASADDPGSPDSGSSESGSGDPGSSDSDASDSGSSSTDNNQ